MPVHLTEVLSTNAPPFTAAMASLFSAICDVVSPSTPSLELVPIFILLGSFIRR
ncbi:hypothetical protein [Clostridium botulinum]|uniref:hypothetical protein n=1 Tax=Clostridium botulinum TaxID=1491 RepID=UPI00396597BC